MIYFGRREFEQISRAKAKRIQLEVSDIFLDKEKIICNFSNDESFVLFTNKRIIFICDVGENTKMPYRDITVLPYTSIVTYGILTSSKIKYAKIELVVPNTGTVTFIVNKANNAKELLKIISKRL